VKRGLVFWLTGLSGAGKTTLAEGAKRVLEAEGLSASILDGDELRARVSGHLGFTEAGIMKNNAMIAGLCAGRRNACDVVFVSIISPYDASRKAARSLLGRGFHLVYVQAPLDCVMARDTKGLYEKARRGKMDNLIGFSPKQPYEAPGDADLVIRTDRVPAEVSVNALCGFIREKSAEFAA